MSMVPGQTKLKHYIAKEPTQQPKFLQEYPSYDGRGVVIAIVDSCIDVSLPGLQQTTTGLPKIIDCFDLTGNGDVDTSTIREADSNNILTGLTGRKLKIPSTWKNPSGKWHLGIKSIYELCDKDALKNITEFRKEKINSQNQALLQNHKFSSKDDKKLMLKYLKATNHLSNDSLVSDCIVWFDGQKWRACIDTSFIGDLESAKVLTNYRDCHEYGIILDRLSYCVTIHNDGNLLEIYATNIDHGTLIANIAAGYYPEEPEKNGLAPGAQIVSFAILDPRSDDTASDFSIKKAFQKCLEMKVDIINYSLDTFNRHIYPLVKEMAEKNGTVIIESAGNEGPLYASADNINSGYHHYVFGCGSCLTSDMVKALYDIDVEHPSIVSLISSRGPASNESNGVTFLAPGHGVADIPKCTPKEERLFSATSYCTPNAVGAIACMLSGLKARNIPISFFKLKLALTNTAFIPEGSDKISFGNGILQIYDAFEFYQTNLKNFPETIKINSDLKDYKTGIFIRQTDSDITVYKRNVEINVINTAKNTPIISWDLKVLSDYENFVIVNTQSDEFLVQINTKSLVSNSINYAEIHGYDSTNPAWGPLFKFPITAIIPKILSDDDTINEEINLSSITPHRLFLVPPPGTQQLFIKLKILEEKNVNVHIHCNDDLDYDNREKVLTFVNKKFYTWCFQISEDDPEVFEICMYQDMKSLKRTKFNLEIKFFGFTEHVSNIWKFCLNLILPLQRMSFVNYLGSIKNASISLSFSQIGYRLFANGIESGVENGKHVIKVEYCLSVTKEATYKFRASYSAFKWFELYYLRRLNIFTASKKFVFGFYDLAASKITLKPGQYKLVGIYEFYKWDPFVIPIIRHMYVLNVFIVFKKPIKPKLFTKDSLSENTVISSKKRITINEDERLEIFYNSVPAADLPPSLPWISRIDGICTLAAGDNMVEFALQAQLHYNIWKTISNVTNAIKEFIQSHLNFDTKTMLENADDMIKLQNIIDEYYSTKDRQQLKIIVDELLEDLNFKLILRNGILSRKDGNIHERRLNELYKTVITDVLFVKTNLFLDQHLNNSIAIPSMFKNKFGSYFVFNNDKEIQKHEYSIFGEFWLVIGFSLNAMCSNFIPNLFQLPSILSSIISPVYSAKTLLPKNNTPELVKSYKKPQQQEIKKACSEFLQRVDDSDVRKSLILIKQALIFGEFGTALFYLNKISTENQSLPEFKVFDEAIIELLKKLGWKHLIEAHENALLDRHRNYYRPL